jgi:hypothetical protein
VASFNWTPDTTFAEWLTVALYLATSLSCWKSGREARREGSRSSNEPRAWRSTAILFLALGVTKQLDLMTALTVLGRAVAHRQGWYERRHSVQIFLIALVATLCLLLMIALLTWIRRAPPPTWLALIGTTLTLAFVVIRAISYHDIDHFLSERILGLPWNSVIEIGGIVAVLLASQWHQVGHSKSTSTLRVRR